MNSATTDQAACPPQTGAAGRSMRIVQQGLAARYRAERRFRRYGMAAIAISLLFLLLLFAGIVANGWTAFRQAAIRLEVELDPAVLTHDALREANYGALIKKAMHTLLPDAQSRAERLALDRLISSGAAYRLRQRVLDRPTLVGQRLELWLPAAADVDMVVKGHLPREAGGRLSEKQLGWLLRLEQDGRVKLAFNWPFLTQGDSREPELAGIFGALMGSCYTLLVTLALSFPIGVAASIYLEEFAPRNRWTDLIEVNINNLAAVPSIVFGLLGLAVFINFFGLPRSAPLVGGLVLALMTMPTIIIAGRAAIQSVPPSIREAALGVGASKVQTVMHHVLPLALPGMLTGTIIGMARALGETAPLLMIGMVAFIVDIPGGFTDPATVLPVQVYLWADSPERAFVERTSAAILVLLGFLVVMNATAVLLRKRFEKRW